MLFYECKISYGRNDGSEGCGKVTETYLIEGINPTDCEKRLIDEIAPFMYGDYEVQSMKKVQYFDMFLGKGEYYKGQVEMINIEDNGSENRKKTNILLTEDSLAKALKKMEGQMACYDCDFVGIAKSPIVDVLRATNEPENKN